MSYLVLARKWRPRSFADLVGQEHVAQTLRNAIAQNRVAHAFLFTGARGVGKTTIARILAKTLNCLRHDGVNMEPCLECAACVEIADGRDPDVRELDAATHNKIEDIRDLQQTLPYVPQRDRHKVVILDECHQITKDGWNALLKTLEEPPAHVKFIFATTEVHKVIPTVLSRCQRYDFRLLPAQLIRERVAHILREEGVRFDDSAVALVAREAAGSMRDALSILDQVLASSQGEITGAAASRLLGVADHKVLYDLARALVGGDAPSALRLIATLTRQGYDLPNVARSLHGVLRDLVVTRVVPEPGELLDVPDEERAELAAIARDADPADLERLFAAWARVTDEVASSREAHWTLEMAAVRLAHRPPLLGADELLLRLRELEQRVASAGPPPAGGEGPRGGGRPPAPSGALGPARPGGVGATGSAHAPAGAPSTTDRFSAPVRRDEPPRAALTDAPMRGQGAAAVAPRVDAVVERFKLHALQARVEPEPTTATPSPAAPEPTVDTQGSAAAMGAWSALVGSMEGPLVPVLKGAVPLEVGPAVVRIAVDQRDSFFRRKLATPEAQSAVADGAERYFGARPTVELVQGVLPDAAPTLARAEEGARLDARRRREEAARANPWVALVCEVLQGEVQRVRFDDDPS